MIILSFDIGIKNLAYCMIDTETNDILDWNILDCSGTNETLTVIKTLDQYDYILEADIVLLEKQPSFNPKMRNISTALYVYFTLRIQHDRNEICKIIFYPAKYKLMCCNTKIEHKSKCKSKLDILLEQKTDLSKSIDSLLNQISGGKKYMKVYKQMKMYNDEELNPVLYKGSE